MTISIIAAIAKDNAIGANNQLLCRLPNDLRRFKRLTTGHTVIMGRKTYDSLPKGALPNRTNVVITCNRQAVFEGCESFESIETAINHHRNEDEIFIIGGASIYKEVIEIADTLYLTCIYHSFDNADAFFPKINVDDWTETESEDFPQDAYHPYPYTFKTFIRKKNPTIRYNDTK